MIRTITKWIAAYILIHLFIRFRVRLFNYFLSHPKFRSYTLFYLNEWEDINKKVYKKVKKMEGKLL